MLKESEHNITIENIPFHFKYGLYCKKMLLEKVINDNTCQRTEFIFTQFEINFIFENLNMLLDKYWVKDFIDNTEIYKIQKNNYF